MSKSKSIFAIKTSRYQTLIRRLQNRSIRIFW